MTVTDALDGKSWSSGLSSVNILLFFQCQTNMSEEVMH